MVKESIWMFLHTFQIIIKFGTIVTGLGTTQHTLDSVI